MSRRTIRGNPLRPLRLEPTQTIWRSGPATIHIYVYLYILSRTCDHCGSQRPRPSEAWTGHPSQGNWIVQTPFDSMFDWRTSRFSCGFSRPQTIPATMSITCRSPWRNRSALPDVAMCMTRAAPSAFTRAKHGLAGGVFPLPCAA
jgi:hypothetical protein